MNYSSENWWPFGLFSSRNVALNPFRYEGQSTILKLFTLQLHYLGIVGSFLILSLRGHYVQY